MSLLKDHIADVGERYRRADWWRNLAWLFVVITLVGLGLFYLQLSRQWMHSASGWGLLGAGFMGCVLVTIASIWKYRDQAWLADRIEENHPELDQRLITSLGELEKSEGKPLGYLQHTVLLETISHAHNNSWGELVSTRMMRRVRTRGLFAMGLMMAAAIGLLKFQPPASAFVANKMQASEIESAVADFDVLVEPGDMEVERGDNLIVVARFGKSTPKDVELVSVAVDGSEKRNMMSQSLDDPLFGSTLYEITEPMQYFVSYSGTETKRYQVKVFVLPELVRSDAILDFPSYTEQPQKVIEDTRRVSAVERSTLTWKLHVNKPGIQAKLVPRDEEAETIELQVDPTDPHTLVTSLELTKSRTWMLQLTDAQGRENRSPPTLKVKVAPNKPAKLKLELARDARVSPLEEFLVKATVSDDYGLQKFGISYTIASTEDKDVVLGESIPRGEKAIAEHLLDFEAMDAEPDQLLSYFFWAEDKDAEGKPRRTLGDMFFTEVRHFEEIFRQGEQPPGGQPQPPQQQQESQNAQDAEELSEVQKQIINATWNVMRGGNNDEKKLRDDVSVILESQQSTLEQAAEMSQNLEDPESKDFMLVVQERMQDAISELTNAYSETSLEALNSAIVPERGAYEALLKLRAREHEIVQQQQQPGQQRSQSASRQRFQQQMEQLQLQNDQNRYETQRQAQEEEDAAQTEMRRAINQLKELAQRQEDLNEQLKELQTALEQAESEKEREEIERQLKRLREQQEEMLRDTDELRERLEQAEDQEAMQEAQEQLDQTREQMRETSESLEKGEVTPALASGTRAQRELEEMREELRRESANQFSEQMREMRDEARGIEERQEELGEQLRQESSRDPEGAGLRNESEDQEDTEALREALREQRERLNNLLEQMKDTVQEAEESEPLLAEGLYDAFRDAEKDQLAEKLEATAQMTERGLTEQAAELDNDVREGLGELREEIDRAADRVLGDQTDALRLAIETLKQLESQLQNEMEQFGESGEAASDSEQQESSSDRQRNSDQAEQQRQESERSGSQNPGENERSENQPPGNQPSENESQQSEQSQESQQSGNQPGESQNPSESEEPQDGQSESQSPGNQQGGQQEGSQQPRGQQQPQQGRSGGGQPQEGGNPLGGNWDQRLAAPITGDDFREWSDQLRDVEEIVDDPELRAEAARIREQARSFRREFKRHSEEPKWELIKELVSRPLRELRQDVSSELLRRAAEKNAIVPIDKDPVPKQFTEQVRRYYENLGTGE